jgi:hypothetical protein
MSARLRPSSAIATLAAGVAAFAIGGCGGTARTATVTVGQRSIPPSSAANVPISTPVQADAYAHAVNLQPTDLPDLRVTRPEGPSTPGPHEGAFAACLGETAPRLAVARVHSAAFQDAEGFEHIRSTVVVQPSEAIALRNYRAFLQPRLLACLKTYLPKTLAARQPPRLRYGSIRATRLTGLPIPDSAGVEIRVGIITSTLRHPLLVYVDEYDFVDGPAEIGLMTEGTPQPLPAEAEARLLSLLHNRAKRFLSQATDRSGSTRSGPIGVTPAQGQGPKGSAGLPTMPEPAGYSGEVGVPPRAAVFWGVGTTISSVGYSDDHAGLRIARWLKISSVCQPGRACRYSIRRALEGEPGENAWLVKTAAGWRASFPIRRYTCRYVMGGKSIYWPQQTTMIFRFGPGGRTLEGRERDYSFAPECGYGASEENWTGSRGSGARAEALRSEARNAG